MYMYIHIKFDVVVIAYVCLFVKSFFSLSLAARGAWDSGGGLTLMGTKGFPQKGVRTSVNRRL